LYQRLARVIIDLTVSIMNVHGPRIARSKRASASDNQSIESRFRSAQNNIQISSDTTESLVRAAWTEGNTDSPKIGKLHAPQPVPIPDRSFAAWTALIAEICKGSPDCENEPALSSPPPRRFGSIDNNETLRDVPSLFNEGFTEEMTDMAEAEDAKQKKSVLDKIEEQVPAV
jgi:hypothetical protein